VLALDLGGKAPVVLAPGSVALTRAAAEALADLASLLGNAARAPDLPQRLAAVVGELLAQREAARARKAWEDADTIREILGAQGIRIEDSRTASHALSEFSVERGLPAISVILQKV
jgi:cysteinyl-tRNA synthetase